MTLRWVVSSASDEVFNDRSKLERLQREILYFQVVKIARLSCFGHEESSHVLGSRGCFSYPAIHDAVIKRLFRMS